MVLGGNYNEAVNIAVREEFNRHEDVYLYYSKIAGKVCLTSKEVKKLFPHLDEIVELLVREFPEEVHRNEFKVSVGDKNYNNIRATIRYYGDTKEPVYTAMLTYMEKWMR